MVSAAPLVPRSSLTTCTSMTCRRLMTSWILYWRRKRGMRSCTSSSASAPPTDSTASSSWLVFGVAVTGRHGRFRRRRRPSPFPVSATVASAVSAPSAAAEGCSPLCDRFARRLAHLGCGRGSPGMSSPGENLGWLRAPVVPRRIRTIAGSDAGIVGLERLCGRRLVQPGLARRTFGRFVRTVFGWRAVRCCTTSRSRWRSAPAMPMTAAPSGAVIRVRIGRRAGRALPARSAPAGRRPGSGNSRDGFPRTPGSRGGCRRNRRRPPASDGSTRVTLAR